MTPDVREALEQYLSSGAHGALAAFHAAMLAQPDFSRATPWFDRAAQLSTQSRYDEVIRLVTAHMPGAFACSDAHLMLSLAFAGIGDENRATREAFYAQVTEQMVRDSGDGTEQRPWQVLHVADEYTLLRSEGVQPTNQRLVERDSRLFDMIACSDGTERWFEMVGSVDE